MKLGLTTRAFVLADNWCEILCVCRTTNLSHWSLLFL